MNDTLMSVSFNSNSYNEYYEKVDDEGQLKYVFKENQTVLRSSNFFETKNI